MMIVGNGISEMGRALIKELGKRKSLYDFEPGSCIICKVAACE